MHALRSQMVSSLGAFLGLACIAGSGATQPERIFLVGSFGATCVLVHGCPDSPLAQPRNVIGGHMLSALVGAIVATMPLPSWVASSLAVALSIFVMERTSTVHPPGGATALIATLGSDHVKALGLWFPVFPIGLGAAVLVATAIVSNRIGGRVYPNTAAAKLGARMWSDGRDSYPEGGTTWRTNAPSIPEP